MTLQEFETALMDAICHNVLNMWIDKLTLKQELPLVFKGTIFTSEVRKTYQSDIEVIISSYSPIIDIAKASKIELVRMYNTWNCEIKLF